MTFWSTITQKLPSVCQICGLIVNTRYSTLCCEQCQRYFSQHQPRCHQCGLTTASRQQQCGTCLQKPPPWQRLYCLGDYDFPLSQYLHQIKYQRHFWLIAPLAALLANNIATAAPQFVYVPSRWRRQLMRGFNQSELLALELTKHFPESHLLHDAFQLRHGSAVQQSLTRSQRIHNLKHAFTLNKKPLSSHVAIIDDVVTTGSTVGHLSELLLEHGVKKIDIYCLCRTPDNNQQ